MIIYKIKNIINGKIYIGQTIQTIENRWGRHISVSKKRKYYLANAINKYGPEKFEVSVLETYNSPEELKEKEKIWIAIYNSTNPNIGYNLTKGGEGTIGRKCSEETKAKISKANTGRTLSYETRKKFSEMRKGCKNSMFGKRHSFETRTQMSIDRKGEKNHRFGKSVPEEIKKKIRDAQLGEKNHMYGKHHTKEQKEKISKNNPCRKIICQYTLNNEFIKEWESIAEAGSKLKIDNSCISKVCKNKLKTAGGFIWRYK